MWEDNIFPPDQEGMFKDEVACFLVINMTTSTTEMMFLWMSIVQCLYGGVFDIWSDLNHPIVLIMEPFKKKPYKILDISKPGGWGWGGLGNTKLFFVDYFGFFLKALGKHWKWFGSSRNAKKYFSLLWGRGYLLLYSTVLYKIVQYTVKIWSANFFSSISGWIRTYSFVSMCFWAT